MTARAFALVLAIGLPLASGAYAALAASKAPPAADQTTDTQSVTAPLPVRWVPEWLMAPLSRAIADATDPRDRK